MEDLRIFKKIYCSLLFYDQTEIIIFFASGTDIQYW